MAEQPSDALGAAGARPARGEARDEAWDEVAAEAGREARRGARDEAWDEVAAAALALPAGLDEPATLASLADEAAPIWLRLRGLLAGGGLLFVSTTLVNGGNYVFNLVLGRWLGPSLFATLSLVVTLLLVVTFATTTLQLVAAKFAASLTAGDTASESVGDTASEAGGEAEALGGQVAALRAWLLRGAWVGGAVLAALLCLGAPLWAGVFRVDSVWPFVLLGVGMPLYLAQGVDRGVLQGQLRFGRLAASLQAEMWVRLGFGVAFVALGWSVNGAVGAIALSFLATWLVARDAARGLGQHEAIDPETRRAALAFAVPVVALLVGQILVNNSDVLVVKAFFAPRAAGEYASVALVGRIVFFATWSVVATMFPLVARRHAEGARHRHLLWGALGVVAAVSGVITAVAWLAPGRVLGLLFGSAYVAAAPLLGPYALATSLFAAANVVVNHELSASNHTGSYLMVGAGVAQVAALLLFHGSLLTVVLAQVVVMGVFVAATLAWSTVAEARRS